MVSTLLTSVFQCLLMGNQKCWEDGNISVLGLSESLVRYMVLLKDAGTNGKGASSAASSWGWHWVGKRWQRMP